MKNHNNKKRKVSVSDLQLYSLCIIPVVLVFIFSYMPMVGIIIAFKNYKFNLGMFRSQWVGLSNFEFFVKSDVFFQLVRNTLLNNFAFIVLGVLSSVTIAVMLFEVASRNATKTFQTLLITPHFLSWVVVAYITNSILNVNYGYLNQLLRLFGAAPVDWYAKPLAWPPILTLTFIWKNIGMDSVVYYAALMGIDSELFEAAEVDGANKLKRILHITIPSLVPLITILTILKVGNIFRADFGLFYTVTQDGASGNLYSTTNVIDTYIFRTFKENASGNSYGLTSAVGLLQSLVGMILVIACNAASKKVDRELGLF